jgi:hypothetical protein
LSKKPFDLTNIRNRITERVRCKPGDLLDHPGQAWDHPEQQAQALAGILRELGQVDTLKAYRSERADGALVCIDGHLRRSLDPALEWDVDVLDLSDAEADYMLAVFDPVGTMKVADKAALDALLSTVNSGEAAVQQMLADEAAKAGLYLEDKTTKDAPEPQTDKAAELQVKWGTATGQLWQLGKHRLLCGDSGNPSDVERLLMGESAPTVVFDPPYDADASIVGLRWICSDALVFTDHRHLLDAVSGWPSFRSAFVWDCVTSWYTPNWPLARAKFCLWFGGNKYDQDGAHYGEPDKPHTVRNTRGEYNYRPDGRGKHLSTVFQSPITQEFDGHSHAKPVDWMRMLIANCTSGTVFDPFGGGGTSIVACEQLKRSCLSIEIEAGNVAVILERLSSLGLTPRLVGTHANRS